MSIAAMKSWLPGVALALGLCLGVATVAQGVSTTVLNPDDVRILKGAPNTNYDPDPTGFPILSVYTVGTNVQRSLIDFNLDSLAGCTIQSATLTLYANTGWGTNSGLKAMDIYRVTRAWDEDDATWNSADVGVPWTTPGGDFTGTGGGPYATSNANPANNQPTSWDVTTLVAEWVSGAQANDGLMLLSYEGNRLTFWSNNYGVEAYRPSLEVQYLPPPPPVPEPVTAALLALNGLGLAGYLRRRLS